MGYALLVVAIVCEVCGALMLRIAALGRKRFYALVVAAYVVAFTFLSLSLSHGVPLGVAYGVWAASGVALTAVASRVLFGEQLSAVMALGIVLIGAGVVLLELGAAHSA